MKRKLKTKYKCYNCDKYFYISDLATCPECGSADIDCACDEVEYLNGLNHIDNLPKDNEQYI